MKIRTMLMVCFSVAGLVAAGWSGSGTRAPAAAPAAAAQPGAGDATTAPPSADFASVVAASDGVHCHSPKRCCEWHPSGHGMCLNEHQCQAGTCP